MFTLICIIILFSAAMFNLYECAKLQKRIKILKTQINKWREENGM